MIQLIIFLSVLSLVQSACKDLDAAACATIKSKMPGMCNDTCMALICSDTCNNCPLKCFHCDNQLNPEDCNTSVHCQSMDEVCIAIQKLTADYIPLYSSGCEKRDVCVKVFGNINVRRSMAENQLDQRALTLKGGCCDLDNCNSHDPEYDATEPPGYVRTTIASNLNPTYSPGDIICSGSNLDETACTALLAADKDICSKNCIAQKVCQSMCKTCLKCYKCHLIDAPEACNTTEVCRVNQNCVTVEQLGMDFLPKFRTGCMNNEVCTKYFGQPSSNPVGKRQVRLQGGCCNESLCNNRTMN